MREDRGSNKVRIVNPEMKYNKLRSLKEYVREGKGDKQETRPQNHSIKQ